MNKTIKLFTAVTFLFIALNSSASVYSTDKESVLEIVREALWHDGVYVSKNSRLRDNRPVKASYPEELLLPVFKEVYLVK